MNGKPKASRLATSQRLQLAAKRANSVAAFSNNRLNLLHRADDITVTNHKFETVMLRAGRFPWWLRLILFIVGCGLAILLVTAARLQPAAKGFGTHQQLGLPPCAFTELFGIRCPSCGMTTSWAHAARGDVFASGRANSGGLLLAITAAALAPWFLVSAVRGAWLWRRPTETFVVAIALTIIFTIMIDWGLRLFVLS